MKEAKTSNKERGIKLMDRWKRGGYGIDLQASKERFEVWLLVMHVLAAWSAFRLLGCDVIMHH